MGWEDHKGCEAGGSRGQKIVEVKKGWEAEKGWDTEKGWETGGK